MKLKYIVIPGIAGLLIIATIILTHSPGIIENMYTNYIYGIVLTIVNIIPAKLPFSLAEFLISSFLVSIIIYLGFFIFNIIFKKNKLQNLKKFFLYTTCFAVFLYLSYLTFWGFNYYREDITDIFGYEQREFTLGELTDLCNYLCEKSNAYRLKVKESESGIMKLSHPREYTYKDYKSGYKIASTIYPIRKDFFSDPKPVLLSDVMCYLGTCGFYFAYTGEANINNKTPDSYLPFVLCHEIAHQKGFAQEDDANFISYLACIHSNNDDFVYSGYLILLLYSMDALHNKNQDMYMEIKNKLSEEVSNDIIHLDNFFQSYQGFITHLFAAVYNSYLKTYNQNDGIQSYGRVVELALLHFKNNHIAYE